MKKRLIATVLLATVLFMTGCGISQSAEVGPFTAGTYVGAGEGKNGPVQVEVVFSENNIESVKVTDHSETAGLSDPAISSVPAAIVEQQSLDVDIVAGASMTSIAIKHAVADAVVQAGGEDNVLLDVNLDANPADAFFESAVEAIEKPEAVNGVIEVATYDQLKKALGYYAYIVNPDTGDGKFMYVDGSAVAGDTIKLISDMTAEGEKDNPNFADGSDKIDVVTGSTILVTDNVTIDGNGKTIYGDGYPTFMFTGKMEDYGNDAIEADLVNITIDGGAYAAKIGGTVFVAGAATLNLEDSTIMNGEASYEKLAFNGGAAIYVNSEGLTPDVGRAVLNAKNSVFTGNVTTNGAGAAVMALNGDINLYDSTFTGNLSLNPMGAGGAVAMRSTSNLLIDNCTITGNKATIAGGGVYIFDGESMFKGDRKLVSEVNALITNSTITGNEAQQAADVAYGRYYSAEYQGDTSRNGLELGDGNEIGDYEDITFTNLERTE